MLFVAGQIIVWIVLAVIFGFLIGWLARGRGKSSSSRGGRRGFR
jgi:hypothetical protein